MNKLSLLLALVVSIFVVGCTDSSSINEPAANASFATSSIKSNPLSEIVPFSTRVTLGINEGIHSQYDVSGKVHYTLTTLDEGNPTWYELSLITSGIVKLTHIDNGEIRSFSGESTEFLWVYQNEKKLVYVSYPIVDDGEELVFNAEFSIHNEKFAIEKVWLTPDN